ESPAAPVVEGVTLASVHAATGPEWPAVFVAGASDGLLPISMATTPARIEEERRLFYGALTRPRDLLTVSWSAARTPAAGGSRRAPRCRAPRLTKPASPRTGPRARPRRTGRGSATVYAEGPVCGQRRAWTGDKRRGRQESGSSAAGEGLLSALRSWCREQTIP